VIEIRYNGAREERPIALSNVKLTIRAAEGFRPAVVFRPAEADPLKYRRAMFTVTASQATLVNLAVELDVPRDIQADNWSLFEVRQGAAVRLEKCLLTVRNAAEQGAYHPDTVFFRVRGAAPDAGGDVAAPRATIALADCVVRGEADVLGVHQGRPVDLAWDNGLLATSGQFLRAEDGPAARPGQPIRIDLRHVTAVAEGGFFRLEYDTAASPRLELQVNCASSILRGASSGVLVEQVGEAAVDELRGQVQWTGDRNFYEDIHLFWSVRRPDQELPADALSAETWRQHWGPQRENVPSFDRVKWKSAPGGERPMHGHAPADYLLAAGAPGEPNPALKAAADGRDAGFEAERLPLFAPPLSKATLAEPR
jgi:hypothetical protein